MIVSRAFGIIGLLGGPITAWILCFFIVRDADQLTHWARTRLVDDDDREAVATAGASGWDSLRGYIQAVVVIGGLDAVLIGSALLALGVPLVVPPAVLTLGASSRSSVPPLQGCSGRWSHW